MSHERINCFSIYQLPIVDMMTFLSHFTDILCGGVEKIWKFLSVFAIDVTKAF